MREVEKAKSKASEAPRVAVVIPIYNGGPAFRFCLESVLQNSPPADEVVVVSDGSTDGSAEVAESLGCRVIRLPENRGCAEARNAGVRAVECDVLLFIDGDVSVPSDLVRRIRSRFAEDSQLAACFGSYDARPAAPGLVSKFRNLLHHYLHQTARPQARTFWTGCGAVRRDFFRELGGFYDNPMEDMEFGYRMAVTGRRVLLDPTLQVTHHKRWTFWSMLYTDVFMRTIPWTELIWKSGRLPDDLNLSSFCRWSGTLLAVLGSLLLALPFLSPSGRLGAGAGALILISALLFVNRGFYAFLARVQGPLFLLGAVPVHWIHYTTSGAAFGLISLRCAATRLFRRERTRAAAEGVKNGNKPEDKVVLTAASPPGRTLS